MEILNNFSISSYIFGITIFIIFYILLKKGIPYIFEKIKKVEKVDINRVDILKKDILRILNIISAAILIIVLFNIPFVKPYIKKIFDFPVIDTEAVRISFYSLVKGGFVFYVLISITKVLRKSIEIYLYRKHEEEVITTVDILLYNIAIIIIVLITLSVMGISWKLLIPIAGALGIGIGFGIQDIVNNFISGLIILLTKTV